jgi:hypothetical protein
VVAATISFRILGWPSRSDLEESQVADACSSFVCPASAKVGNAHAGRVPKRRNGWHGFSLRASRSAGMAGRKDGGAGRLTLTANLHLPGTDLWSSIRQGDPAKVKV